MGRENKEKREGPRLRTDPALWSQGDEEGRASETQDAGVRWGKYPERRVLWRTEEWMPGKEEPIGQTGGWRNSHWI